MIVLASAKTEVNRGVMKANTKLCCNDHSKREDSKPMETDNLRNILRNEGRSGKMCPRCKKCGLSWQQCRSAWRLEPRRGDRCPIKIWKKTRETMMKWFISFKWRRVPWRRVWKLRTVSWSGNQQRWMGSKWKWLPTAGRMAVWFDQELRRSISERKCAWEAFDISLL